METMTPAYAVFYALGTVAVPLTAYGVTRWIGESPLVSFCMGAMAAVAFAVLA